MDDGADARLRGRAIRARTSATRSNRKRSICGRRPTAGALDRAERDAGHSDLAGWAARARGIAIDDNGRGVIPCGDAMLVTRDAGQGWVVAAVGDGMFLDAAIDAQGHVLAVGRRIHRCAGGAFDFEHVLRRRLRPRHPWAPKPRSGDSIAAYCSASTGEVAGSGRLIPDAPGRLRRIAALGDYDLWLQFDGAGREVAPTGRAIAATPTSRSIRPASCTESIRWSILDSLSRVGGDARRSPAQRRWRRPLERIARIVSTGSRRSGRDRLTPCRWCAPRRRSSTRPTAASTGSIGPTPPTGALPRRSTSPPTAGGSPPDPASTAPRRPIRGVSPPPIAPAIHCGTSRSHPTGPDGRPAPPGFLLETDDAGRTVESLPRSTSSSTRSTDLRPDELPRLGRRGHGRGRRSSSTFFPIAAGRSSGSASRRTRSCRAASTSTSPPASACATTRCASEVDGVDLPATLIDPDGYLYRARFEIPADPSEQLLTVSGRDWGGNERSDARALLALVLDRDGRRMRFGTASAIRFDGGAAATVVLLGGRRRVRDTAPRTPDLGGPLRGRSMLPRRWPRGIPASDHVIRWDGDRLGSGRPEIWSRPASGDPRVRPPRASVGEHRVAPRLSRPEPRRVHDPWNRIDGDRGALGAVRPRGPEGRLGTFSPPGPGARFTGARSTPPGVRCPRASTGCALRRTGNGRPEESSSNAEERLEAADADRVDGADEDRFPPSRRRGRCRARPESR